MPKKRKVRRKSTKRRKAVSSKRRLVGFTKVGPKFALVFSKRGKPSLGNKRFGSKKTMLSAARKALTKK